MPIKKGDKNDRWSDKSDLEKGSPTDGRTIHLSRGHPSGSAGDPKLGCNAISVGHGRIQRGRYVRKDNMRNTVWRYDLFRLS